MNTKTVKEKVEEIIKEYTIGYCCKVCGGGGSIDGNGKEVCSKCNGFGITDWDFKFSADKIDKLYRKEMLKEICQEIKDKIPKRIDKTDQIPFDSYEERLNITSGFNQALYAVNKVLDKLNK